MSTDNDRINNSRVNFFSISKDILILCMQSKLDYTIRDRVTSLDKQCNNIEHDANRVIGSNWNLWQLAQLSKDLIQQLKSYPV